MIIERNHTLGRQTAIKQIDNFLERLMCCEFPGGIKIQEPQNNWSGNELSFSFKAKKSFMGAFISGKITVTDSAVVLKSDLPAMVTAFINEDKLGQIINDQLDNLFQPENE